MTDNKPALEPSFEAVLSRKQMEEGELKHSDIEHLRKISMFASLTHSSEELESICSTNPKAFHDALKFGIDSIDHYQNLVLLLENSILRIYSVAANHSAWKGGEDIENLEEKIQVLLSENTNEHQH